MATKKLGRDNSYRIVAPYVKWAPERMAMQGEIVDDLPQVSIPWLLAEGAIEVAAENQDGE